MCKKGHACRLNAQNKNFMHSLAMQYDLNDQLIHYIRISRYWYLKLCNILLSNKIVKNWISNIKRLEYIKYNILYFHLSISTLLRMENILNNNEIQTIFIRI